MIPDDPVHQHTNVSAAFFKVLTLDICKCAFCKEKFYLDSSITELHKSGRQSNILCSSATLPWMLIHSSWSKHIFIKKISHHSFRQWLFACSMPSHYQPMMTYCQLDLGNKFQWNFDKNTTIFIEENEVENVVCIMSAILSGHLCVNGYSNGLGGDW